MASQQDSFSKYPREVLSSTQRPFAIYTLLPDYYAVHQPSVLPLSDDAISAMSDDNGTIEIFRGEAEEGKPTASLSEIGPVYALQSGGTLAVPTGRVFIRFKAGVSVNERLMEIEQAGYKIVMSLEYAPHTAWLRARSGEIIDALTGIQALEKIGDVENVEPQMLMQRASR